MAIQSSPSRMDGLLDLAHRDGIDIKPTLLRVLTDLYVQTPTHTADEEAQFVELACRLIRDVDDATRAAVGARLAAYPHVPPAIMRALANAPLEPSRDAVGAATIEAASEPPVGAPVSVRDSNSDPDANSEAELDALFGGQAPSAKDLNEQFFRANAEERLMILRNLEFAPLEPALAPSGPRVEAALERMVKAGMAARKIVLAAEIGALLHLPRSLCERIVQDDGGEPLACALRACGMPLHVYQRIILFLDPAIGQSVTRVFALSNIYKDVTPRSAQIMLGLWRDLAARANGSRHQTQLQDDARRARTTASQAAPQTASQVQPQTQAQSSAPAAKPAPKLTVRLVPVLKKATSSGA